MYPGQGSQYYHMASELYASHPVFRSLMQDLDALVFRQTGISVLDHLYHPNAKKSDDFDNILITHHAIFMVEFSLTRVLMSEGIYPDYVLGASLGEVTCAAITESLSIDACIDLLMNNSRVVTTQCKQGAMLAIINSCDLYYDTPLLYQQTELASINYPQHFVISGEEEAIQKIALYLRDKQILSQQIIVKYGFHSYLMESARHELQQYYEKIPEKQPSIPWISCATTDRLPVFTGHHFWPVFRDPIHFHQTILKLEMSGSYHYIDAGPTGTLSTFVKKILRPMSGSVTSSVLTPYGLDMKMLNQLIL